MLAKGADISWLPAMERDGYQFYNAKGEKEDCISILKAHGINSVRLRVFYQPSDDLRSGGCGRAATIAMARRCQDMGMRIMIDFHYSDSWADPQRQEKPAAWANHTADQLATDVYKHTYDVLSGLKEAGVVPEWVQIGNEIRFGMLWPEGHSDHMPTLARLLNSGYQAVKDIDSRIASIIHLDVGNDHGEYLKFFQPFFQNGGICDVIGISYYPYWLQKSYTETIADLAFNLSDMVSRYHKEVMVCEMGEDYLKPEESYQMFRSVLDVVKNIENQKGLGVFLWEPQGAFSWSGYRLVAWGDDGRPTKALQAFI